MSFAKRCRRPHDTACRPEQPRTARLRLGSFRAPDCPLRNTTLSWLLPVRTEPPPRRRKQSVRKRSLAPQPVRHSAVVRVRHPPHPNRPTALLAPPANIRPAAPGIHCRPKEFRTDSPRRSLSAAGRILSAHTVIPRTHRTSACRNEACRPARTPTRSDMLPLPYRCPTARASRITAADAPLTGDAPSDAGPKRFRKTRPDGQIIRLFPFSEPPPGTKRAGLSGRTALLHFDIKKRLSSKHRRRSRRSCHRCIRSCNRPRAHGDNPHPWHRARR